MSVATQPRQRSKNIRLFRNGDPNYPGHAICVNVQQTRNWDAFLDKITSTIKPTFGTVWRLYNPETGRVVRDFSKLQEGKAYVAAGRERFKKLAYSAIADPKQTLIKNRVAARAKTVGDLPRAPTRIIRSGRAKKMGTQVRAISISLAVNGDLTKDPVKLLVNHAIRNLEVLMDVATRKLKPKFGAIRKIVTVDGKRLNSLHQLQNQGRYVAVGQARFKKLPYFEPNALIHANTAPMIKSSPSKKPKTKNKTPPNDHVRDQQVEQSQDQQVEQSQDQQVEQSQDQQVEQSMQLSSMSPTQPNKLEPREKVQSYNVTVETGNADDHGTDANVYITLIGDQAESKRVMLREDSENFSPGSKDVFAIESSALGTIQSLIIEQDDSGVSSAWFVKRVTVRDSVTNQKVYFHVNRWLSSDRNGSEATCKIAASLEPEEAHHSQTKDDADDDHVFAAAPGQVNEAEIVEDNEETVEDHPVDAAAASAVVDENADIVVQDANLDLVQVAFQEALQDSTKLRSMWSSLDYNGNNIVSLAELDKWVSENYPPLDHKPALMRCFKKTTLRDGDGDAWLEKKEFPMMLINLVYFVRLFRAFDDIDTNDDRRLDLPEFIQGLDVIGLSISESDAAIKFSELDHNDGGFVLFDEFAAWAAREACPVNDDVMTAFTTSDERSVE